MPEKGLSRRELLRRGGLAAVGLASVPSVLAACGGGEAPAAGEATSPAGGATTQASVSTAAGSASAEISGTIDYLSWEGYDLLVETESWRDENGVELRSAYIADQGEIQAKLNANTGVTVDLITYPQGWRDLYLQEGLIGPLDKAALPNLASLYPFFQEGSAWLDDAGNVIGVPFTWGTSVMNYNADEIEAPASWADLLEPDLKGKVGWTGNAIASIKLAAIVLGFDSNPDLTKEQLDACMDWLRQLRDQIRGFAPSYGDLTAQLVSGEVLVTFDGWAALDSFAAAQGGNVRSLVPSEGTHSFADAYGIPPGADGEASALAFINNALTPEVQAAQAKSLSAGVVTPDAVPLLDPEVASLYPYDSIDTVIESAPFLGIPPLTSPDGVITTREEWVAEFEKLKAGQ